MDTVHSLYERGKLAKDMWEANALFLRFRFATCPMMPNCKVCIRAYWSLHLRYSSGIGVPQSENQAAKWMAIIVATTGDEIAISWLNHRNTKEQNNGKLSRATSLYNLGLIFHEANNVRKNDERALRLFEEAAYEGFGLAQYTLYRMYRDGQGVEQDEAKSVYWLRKAASVGRYFEAVWTLASVHNDPHAQYTCGELYALGQKRPRLESEDADFFFERFRINSCGIKKCARCSCAFSTLYDWYSEGRYVEQNDVKAVEWLRKYAESGVVEGMLLLAHVYYYAEYRVARDDMKAYRWFQKAAAEGSSHAAYFCGQMCLLGEGVTKSIKQAELYFQQFYTTLCPQTWRCGFCAYSCWQVYQIKENDYPQSDGECLQWLRKSADLGDVEGMWDLGHVFAGGRHGVVRNDTEAFSWFQKAARNGSPHALYRCGQMCSEGKEIDKEGLKQAQVYFDQFYAALCKPITQCNFCCMASWDLYLFFSGEVVNDTVTALKWLAMSAEGGFGNALNEMGRVYDFGLLGERKDFKKSLNWYAEAVAQDHEEAIGYMANVYRNGLGVPRDDIKAIELYLKLAVRGNGEAQWALVTMFGVVENEDKKIEWCIKAAINGIKEARELLYTLHPVALRLVLQDVKESIEWLPV